MSYSGAKFHVFNCPDADLALTVTDDECEPYIPRGAAALVSLGGVVFDGVDFGYTDGKLVLHDIRMYAEPGQKIALVGSTGAGKTTITNLIR